jgi:hypothetical protein
LPSTTIITSCNDATVAGVYNIRPQYYNIGPVYKVYCDPITAGGPWMLTYAYNHIGGQNNALVSGTIPISPTAGYSHVDVNTFVDSKANKVFKVNKVRFFCQTAFHARKIHFYTPNAIVNQMAFDGGNTGDVPSIWTSGFTTYADHTAYLPASTTNVVGPLYNFPFYSSTYGTWGIRGFDTRWECDDYSNGYAYTSLFQIWVNAGKEFFHEAWIILMFHIFSLIYSYF